MIDEEDEEEIEEFVKKQFNGRLNQYEYLVKWKGYSSKHNTWELITNIPDDLLRDFEVPSIMPSATAESAPSVYGLRDRQSIKPRYNPGYISS